MLSGMFCMRLHTGGVVIGYLGTICGFISIIALSVILGCANYIAKKYDPSNAEDFHTFIVIMGSIMLAIDVMWFLSSILLVIGTMKNRHFLILPWLVNSILYIVFTFIADVLFCIVLAILGAPPIMCIFPILYLFVLALYVYIYCAIHSLFAHIRANKEENDYNVMHTSRKSCSDIYPNYNDL